MVLHSIDSENIRAGGVVEQPQSECRCCHRNVLEERALDGLVGSPCRGGSEAPYLKGYAVLGRCHEPYKYLIG